MDEGSCALDTAELVRRHYALVYRYAYRLCGSAIDAEDLTQQAFLAAQEKLDQLREPDCAKGWLCTIVRHVYLKGFRGRGSGVRPISLDRVAEPPELPPAEPMIDDDELQAALAEMPEEFRTPLILFYFEEFSYREIAEQMEVPIGTVMSRLARAKSHLRQRLLAHVPAGSRH